MSGADEIIATLSARVSELGKRVATLQAELDAAQRRIAVYDESDAIVQDAISSALRAAYEIRERAETTASQLLEQTREERRLLLKEIERLRDERDQLQNEIAERRRSSLSPVAPRPVTTDASATEIRQLASEALRGLFQEIVDDIRAARPAQPPPPEPVRAAPEPPAPEPVRETPPPAEPAGEPVAPPAAPVEDAPPPLAATAAPAEDAPPPVAATAAPEPEPEPEPAAPVEDVEPAARPEEAADRPGRFEVLTGGSPMGSELEEMAPPRVVPGTPTSELSLMLSPVGSFPRLVEIERHIQRLPAVRTLYVRDFRAGTATLAVALRSALTPEEFTGMLVSLDGLRLRVMASARNVIELRIDGEASIA